MRPMNNDAADLDKFIRTMDSFLGHPGWALFHAELAKREEVAFLSMVRAMSADDSVVATKVFTTLRQIREMPTNELKLASEQLRALSKK